VSLSHRVAFNIRPSVKPGGSVRYQTDPTSAFCHARNPNPMNFEDWSHEQGD